MILMGAGTNHWFHSDTIYRAFLDPDHAHRLPGRQRRRLGALRRPGEGAARSPAARQFAIALDWTRPPRHDDPDRVLVPAHRPVPLRPRSAPTRSRRTTGAGSCAGKTTADVHRADRPDGLDAVATRRSTATRSTSPTRPRRPGKPVGRVRRRRELQGRRAAVRRRGPGRAGELPAGAVDLAGQPARLLGQGQRVLPQAPARHRLVAAGDRGAARGTGRATSSGATRRRGQARPAADPRLPDDEHHDLLRRRAAGGHLVREARPQHHRHAPVRALVQPGDRPAVADPHRLRRLPDASPRRSASWPRRTSASARTSSPCR